MDSSRMDGRQYESYARNGNLQEALKTEWEGG